MNSRSRHPCRPACEKKVPGTVFLDKNLSRNLVPGTFAFTVYALYLPFTRYILIHRLYIILVLNLY
jgi:hypothetical protein